MSVTVKYKGSAIAALTENGTKTLKTSGKYCEADIVVENTKDGGTQVTDGIVVKARSAEGFPTEADVYGDLYPYQFSYDGMYYHGTIGWRSLSKLTLKSGQTVLKEGCFAYYAEAVKEDDEVIRYKTIEEIPEGYRAETKELIELGFNGYGDQRGLYVTEDMLRCMIINLRMCKALIAAMPEIDKDALLAEFKKNLKLNITVEVE